MKNKINALFYNFKEIEIEKIIDELRNIDYSLQYSLVSDLSKIKTELMNSNWDIIVLDQENADLSLEEILDFIKDINSKITALIVSDKIDSNLIQQIFINGKNDLVSKTCKGQISLALIRNFEKTKANVQAEFTKKELIRSQISQSEHGHFLNQIIESTTNPIFYKGVGDRYLGCNTAFANFIGLPKDEIIGKTVFDVSPKELAQKYYEMDKDFFKNPGTQQLQYQVVHSDGHVMDVIFYKTAIRDEEGNVVGLLGHMFDITNKQKAEDALKESEQKYKMLVENMQEGLSIVDLNEQVVFCNPAFDKIFGFEAGGMIGENLKDYFLEDDLHFVFNETSKRKENKTSQYKIKIKRKDKSKRFINVSSVPWKNSKDEIVGALGMIMDVTAQEYSTKRLQKRIEIEHSVIKISSQFIALENFNTKLDKTLKELRNIIGAERYNILILQNEMLKLTNEQFDKDFTQIDDGFDEIPYNALEYSINMLESFDFIFYDNIDKIPEVAAAERELFKKHKIFNLLGLPFYTDSKIIGFLFISNIYEVDEWTIEDLSLLRTVTEIIGHAYSRNKAEEKVKQLNLDLIIKNEELEQVVYVTSHDIRSPVVNILGFSDEMIKALNKLSDKIYNESNTIQNKDDIELLLKNDIPQILNFIKVSGHKIDKLLFALLKLSRLGRAAINKINVDMNKLVSEVVNTFEYKIKKENILIEVGNMPGCFTDEVAINQVFSNLIDNSIKYRSKERETLIKIAGQESDGYIIYCVEDNGIGISASEIDKIFDVFYRINTENLEGEGIGLSLIKKIIDRLDGMISLGSEEGKGTKFFISLEKQNK